MKRDIAITHLTWLLFQEVGNILFIWGVLGPFKTWDRTQSVMGCPTVKGANDLWSHKYRNNRKKEREKWSFHQGRSCWGAGKSESNGGRSLSDRIFCCAVGSDDQSGASKESQRAHPNEAASPFFFWLRNEKNWEPLPSIFEDERKFAVLYEPMPLRGCKKDVKIQDWQRERTRGSGRTSAQGPSVKDLKTFTGF